MATQTEKRETGNKNYTGYDTDDDSKKMKSDFSGTTEKASEWIADKTEKVKESVQDATQYFKDHDLTDIGKSTGKFLLQNPMASLFLGIGLGIVLDRFLFKNNMPITE